MSIGGTLPPHRGKPHWGSSEYHQAAYNVCSTIVYCPSLQPNMHLPQCSTKNHPRAGIGTPGVGSVRGPSLHTNTSAAGHLNTLAYVNRFRPFRTHS